MLRNPECIPVATTAPTTYATRSEPWNVVPSTHLEGGNTDASHAGAGVSWKHSTAQPMTMAAAPAWGAGIRGRRNTTSQ